MNLKDRIEERRQAELTPIVERRGGTEQRVPAWVKRARDGALYGYDESGQPVGGKDFTGKLAA